LINDVVAEPDQPDVLLVLDDYHLISSDSLQASVRFLLDHRPPQLRVVLASRSDPPLGLARYRGRGELGEVRAADLRASPVSWLSRWTRSRSTSATSWASWARRTAPRRWPGAGNSA
jgi:hypothetical protein